MLFKSCVLNILHLYLFFCLFKVKHFVIILNLSLMDSFIASNTLFYDFVEKSKIR
uniref:Uncharacterized protein n=1 Tax=Arundo donax TaxID=35708 RepID=A0A0A9A3F8_ARUDO